MRKSLLIGLVVLLAAGQAASAQSALLQKAANAAKKKVTNTVEKRINQEADKAADKAVNGAMDAIFGKQKPSQPAANNGNATAASARTAASYTATAATPAQVKAPVDPKTDEWPEYKDTELRNIHTGMQHPEVFSLPSGYRINEVDPMEKAQKAADFLEGLMNKRK